MKLNKSERKASLSISSKLSFASNKTPKWFYIVLFILPILILIILELSLHLFNYGKDNREWISINDNFEILNPDISYRYFTNLKNVPFSTESFLLKEKPSNSIRIITLGASSAAGFPYQNSGSFTKYIRKALEFDYSNKKIEVANLSMAAVNSYTILDILPSVVEKKPDAILIYLGHNEYYGALGAASDGIFNSSRFFKLLRLKLSKYKIVELINDFISMLSNLNIEQKKNSDETLMANIAKNKLVEYNSELYSKGIEQFQSNLNEILEICRNNNIPVIISTLVSNLKDLSPFISVEDKDGFSANTFFKEANDLFGQGKIKEADSLFRLAKDYDALRFRAPERINTIIKNFSDEKEVHLINIDSLLNLESKFGIVGNDLMVDHLHPNLIGYQKLGKYFYQSLREKSILSSKPKNNYSVNHLDSLVRADFNFTKYDSTIADYRINILKNDWPFVNDKNKRTNFIKSNSIEGEIALDVLNSKISRYDARLKLSDYYFKNKNYDSYSKEILALFEEFPIDNKILNEAADRLIKNKNYTFVEKLLKKSFDFNHDAFNTKWLGIMYVSQKKIDDAKKYLEMSLDFNNLDPQVLFNLSGVYFQLNEFEKSYKFIIRCLSISPNYQGASSFKSYLESIVQKK